jgi:hypothetical protein
MCAFLLVTGITILHMNASSCMYMQQHPVVGKLSCRATVPHHARSRPLFLQPFVLNIELTLFLSATMPEYSYGSADITSYALSYVWLSRRLTRNTYAAHGPERGRFHTDVVPRYYAHLDEDSHNLLPL